MKRSALALLTAATFATVSAVALAQNTEHGTPAPGRTSTSNTQTAQPGGTPAPSSGGTHVAPPSPGEPVPSVQPHTPPPGTPAPSPSPETAPAPSGTANEPAGTAAPAQPSAQGSAAPAPASAAAPSPAAQNPPAGPPPDTTALEPRDVSFSFEGPFGTFDRASLQRGFQVYKEVCSACHSLKRIAFHNLADEGGPGFSEAQAKAIAAGFQVPADPDDQGRTYNDSGERITRPGIPADYFPWKFENEKAARAANNGALPPDLSLIVKAREGGPEYVYSILTGFGQKPPANEPMGENMNYNPYFPGHQIAMPPPLSDGVVTYSDGTKATVAQMAHDVVTFLAWTAEPKMEERKRMGFGAMIFLFLLTGLLYFAYHRIWHGKHDVDVA
jgi:cytochrome c1